MNKKWCCTCFNAQHHKSFKPRKPDSVFALSFICDKHCCLPVAAYPGPCPPLNGIEDEQPSNEPIRGITAPKVYPCHASLLNIVGSYPTFSPSPLVVARPTTAVIFCGTICMRLLILVINNNIPAIHRWDALCCPDFPSSA
jgi:hypothetical protein